MRDADDKGVCTCVEQGNDGKSLYFLLHFARNLKPLSKVKVGPGA